MVLSVRELANVDDLPREAWDQLVRDCRASIFFDSHILTAIFHHSVEAPLAIRYFAVMDGADLVAAAVAYALRTSIWWSYYEQLTGSPDLFGGPWIAMPSVLTWNGDIPLRAGSDAAEVAALLVAAGRRFARDHQAVALAITNVTRDAPLTAPLRAQADHAILLDNDAVIPVHASFDAYLASLQVDVRRDLVRRRRRAEERGCRWLTGRASDFPPGTLDRLVDLINSGATRHGQEPEYSLALIRELAAAPSARVFLGTFEGEPIAGFLAHEDPVALHLQAGGWDSSRKELSPFVSIVYEVMAKAHAWSKQAVEFGRTNYVFKRKHGARLSPLHGLFYLTEHADPGLRDRILALDRGIRDYIAAEGGDGSSVLG